MTMKLNEHRGFSLVELMLVISIMGLSVALSIPSFGRFMQSWRLAGETDQVATTMRSARRAAIMKNIDAVFTFDTDAGTYSYFEDTDQDGIKDGSEYQSTTRKFSKGLVFDSHTLSATRLTFGPRGNCNESGEIIIENAIERTKTITIFGGTGNIRVHS
jgi:prepilin-type N-terminal cleavage/methylation domain-containing protein